MSYPVDKNRDIKRRREKFSARSTAKCVLYHLANGRGREESVIIPLGRKRKPARERNFTGGRKDRVSRNACKMPKQDSGTVVEAYIYIYIYISKGCSLFPSPFLSFLRLPIPARVVARMVIMGYHRVGASLARGRDKTLGGWGKYRRFTVVKRNSERIKIPSRFVSFQLRTTGAALPPIRSSAFQTTGVS